MTIEQSAASPDKEKAPIVSLAREFSRQTSKQYSRQTSEGKRKEGGDKKTRAERLKKKVCVCIYI